MKRFVAQGRNTGFVCTHCGVQVPPLANGSYRNHCPYCLWSLHVDVLPGDRANGCGGLLEPIGVLWDARKGWVVVHRCRRCGELRRNKAALDDPELPDDFEVLVRLSSRPVPD